MLRRQQAAGSPLSRCLHPSSAAVAVADLLPAGTPDFQAVLARFQGRLRSVLSNPSLLAQALEEAAVAQQLAEVEGQGAPESPTAQQQAEAQPAGAQRQVASPRRGLFACFGRPAVVEDGQPTPPASPGKEREASARRGQVAGRSLDASARSGAARGEWSAYSGREASARAGSQRSRGPPGEWSARSGRGPASEWSARSGQGLGGSERSVRGGAERRDPSVHSCQQARIVEVLCDTDTAYWSAADFGQPPAPAAGHKAPTAPAGDGCSSRTSRDSCRESSASDCVPRSSPRGLLELNQALGRSVDSLCSGGGRGQVGGLLLRGTPCRSRSTAAPGPRLTHCCNASPARTRWHLPKPCAAPFHSPPLITEADEELQQRIGGLLRSASMASAKRVVQLPGLPRNASLPLLTDKKTRGGSAAAALLSLQG